MNRPKGIMLSKINQRKTNTIWFHLYVESKEQNKHTNKTETYTDTVKTEVGRMGEQVGRSKNLQNSHRGMKYSIGNTVSNILITVDGVRWVWDLLLWSPRKLVIRCLTTGCAPETSIILYVNYKWKIKMIKKTPNNICWSKK